MQRPVAHTQAGCAGRAAPISPARGEAVGHGAGVEARRALFLPRGDPNSPTMGLLPGTQLCSSQHVPVAACVSASPTSEVGCAISVIGHVCWGARAAPGWAWRGSHSFPGRTLERERQAFGNSRDFALNPVGLLGFEDINDISHVAPAQQRKAAALAPWARPEPTSSQALGTEGQSFCHLNTPGLWRGLAAHRGHGLN